ncbi:MAG: hypothetical protein QME78_13145 [Thermodesulfobacteriota bacterium]|nr:hypothetical protein [Thermodesulfobacteriota bacterium]
MGEKRNEKKPQKKLKIGTRIWGDLAHLAVRHRSIPGLGAEIEG